MNIENFSTINLPGLGDTKNWASIKGDDPGLLWDIQQQV